MGDLIERLRKCACGMGSMKGPTGDFGIFDEAADRIAALEASGWQPIETAPKNGAVVWVWCPTYEDLDPMTSLASWHEDAGWCVDELRTPTMWCALQIPPPPSQDRESDSQRGAK